MANGRPPSRCRRVAMSTALSSTANGSAIQAPKNLSTIPSEALTPSLRSDFSFAARFREWREWRFSTLFRVFHRPFRLNHGFVATDEREHVFVTQLLSCRGGQNRAVAATTVHDDFLFRVGEHSLEVPFQDSFAQVDSLCCVFFLPFVVLAHVH